jgi:hypothetical protein
METPNFLTNLERLLNLNFIMPTYYGGFEMLIFKGKKGMALKYQFYMAIYTKNILVNKKMISRRISGFK